MNKKKRQEVYDKCAGHCAYCGIKLDYKDMQVDHVSSKKKNENNPEFDIDNIDNLLPACRSCNFYKSTLDLEGFRNYICTLDERLLKGTTKNQVAARFKIIEPKKFDGVFYFERTNVDNK